MENVLILFDCFGVIYNECSTKVFRDHFDAKDIAKLHQEFFLAGDRGEITLHQIAQHIEERLGFKESQLIQEMHENATIKQDTADLIARLSKHNHLVLVSNITLEMIDYIEEHFDFDAYFEKKYYSCREKIAKPDLALFQRVLDSYPRKFDKVFMIDDSYRNLEHLSSIGIQGILFENAAQVEEELRKQGVVVS